MLIPPRKDCGEPDSTKAFRHRVGSGTSAEMTSPVSGLNPTARDTPLEKFMKRITKTNKASLQGMATGRARVPVFAVSRATWRFVLYANADERKTAAITFNVPGADPFQGTLAEDVALTAPIRMLPATKRSPTAGC